MKKYMYKCSKVLIVFTLTAGLLACKKGESSNSSSNNSSNSSTETAENNTATTEPKAWGTAMDVDLSYLEGVYEGSYESTSYSQAEPRVTTWDENYLVILVNGIPTLNKDNRKHELQQMIEEDKEGYAAQVAERTTFIEFDTETLTGNWTYFGGKGEVPNVVSYTFTKEVDGTITFDYMQISYDSKDPDKKEYQKVGSYTRVRGFE